MVAGVLDWYRTYLVDTGRSAALWALIGFLVTYGVVRWITSRIHAGREAGQESDGPVRDVYIGGVHIHHQVWGILLVLVTGLMEFRFQPASPWVEVIAALFGAGAALALDEFALWLHVDDVYWSEEGRKSIDAVMVAAVVGLALLLGASPIGGARGLLESRGLVIASASIVVLLAYTVICLLKGKIATGLIGLVVPVTSLVGAIRLAKPESYWARRFYPAAKQAKARARFGPRYEARRERLRDLMSGQRRRR